MTDMITIFGWIDIQDAMASFVLTLVLIWFINREVLSRQLEVDQEEAGSRQRLAMVLFLSSWVVRYLIETYECLQPAVRSRKSRVSASFEIGARRVFLALCSLVCWWRFMRHISNSY